VIQKIAGAMIPDKIRDGVIYGAFFIGCMKMVLSISGAFFISCLRFFFFVKSIIPDLILKKNKI
jgi:hypothetical protein